MVATLACDHGALALLFQPTDPFAESLIGDEFTREFIIPLSALRAFCSEPATKRTLHLAILLQTHLLAFFLPSPHLPVGHVRHLPLAASSPAGGMLGDGINE